MSLPSKRTPRLITCYLSGSNAFEITVAGAEPKVLSDQGVVVDSQITFKDAHERLEDFDILIILGGNSEEILAKEAEPLGLINDFSELQKKDPARERTILSICTGSLFLAREGILSGLAATTHPDYITKFENICSDAATRNLQERTDVIEDARYVVNNLRFDLGDEDENPYIRRKSVDNGRRPSNARYAPTSMQSNYYMYDTNFIIERVAPLSRARTPAVNPLFAVQPCALADFGSSRLGEIALALTQLCTLSALWLMMNVRWRWPGSCSGPGTRASSLMVSTFKPGRRVPVVPLYIYGPHQAPCELVRV